MFVKSSIFIRNRSKKGIISNLQCLLSSSTKLPLFSEKLNVLYDSKCFLCRKEIEFLKKRDTTSSIIFTDIECNSYDESSMKNGQITYQEGMEVIHAVKADGTIIKGIDVFKEAYREVGLGFIWSISSLPIIRSIMDSTYIFWAKYRTLMTRDGKSIETLVQEKKESQCKAYDNAFNNK